MCLYIKEKIGYDPLNFKPIYPEMKVADKDIVCYKILTERERDGHKYYRTPFTGNDIGLGEIIDAKGYPDFQNCGSRFALQEGYNTSISGGFIHTFKTKQAAIRIASNCKYDGYWIDDPVIVRCKIPKGTKYYEGVFEGTMLVSYCSKTLQYGTKVEPVAVKNCFGF